MAKRSKRKASKKKSKTAKKSKKKVAKPKRAKTAGKKSGKKAKRSGKKAKPSGMAVKRTASSSANKRVPASPSGEIGQTRPSNQPKPPGRAEPREIAQAEPDARFDDPRRPEANARELPDGSSRPNQRKPGYSNTDEQF